jgi:predicted RNA-binding Zn-ribbon protein involved in translation (DUF1610 family)
VNDEQETNVVSLRPIEPQPDEAVNFICPACNGTDVRIEVLYNIEKVTSVYISCHECHWEVSS